MRASRIGASLAPLGTSTTVYSLTPSRIGTIASMRSKSKLSVFGLKLAGISDTEGGGGAFASQKEVQAECDLATAAVSKAKAALRRAKRRLRRALRLHSRKGVASARRAVRRARARLRKAQADAAFARADAGPAKAADSKAVATQRRMQSIQQGYTGDMCSNCNSMRMKISGHCQVCEECGTTTGCS